MAERRYHTSRSPNAVLEKCETPAGMRNGCRVCHFTSNTAHVQCRKGIHNHRYAIMTIMIISTFNLFSYIFSVFCCGVCALPYSNFMVN